MFACKRKPLTVNVSIGFLNNTRKSQKVDVGGGMGAARGMGAVVVMGAVGCTGISGGSPVPPNTPCFIRIIRSGDALIPPATPVPLSPIPLTAAVCPATQYHTAVPPRSSVLWQG